MESLLAGPWVLIRRLESRLKAQPMVPQLTVHVIQLIVPHATSSRVPKPQTLNPKPHVQCLGTGKVRVGCPELRPRVSGSLAQDSGFSALGKT